MMTRLASAHEVFYPAATVYAVFVLPASVIAMSTGADFFPALRIPTGHAHEMLLGFALAVVAGNQLGAMRAQSLAALLLLWIGARVVFLFAPESAVAGALNAAFAGALALRLVPRLLASAKKWRNQALPGVLAALCLAAVAWQVARYAGGQPVPHTLILIVVALFAFLMLFMGGRIVAPAVAGQFHRQGLRLDARVQPRIEGALLVAAAVTPVALAASTLMQDASQGAVAGALAAALRPLAGGAAIVAGALALVRIARWRLWAVRGRPDLMCLVAGYVWLGIGLIVFGASIAAARYEHVAVHVITIGALGTLTFNVMAMFWSLKARRPQPETMFVVPGTLLIAAATIVRVLGAFQARTWLYAAAACWALAYGLLILLFWRNPRPPARLHP